VRRRQLRAGGQRDPRHLRGVERRGERDGAREDLDAVNGLEHADARRLAPSRAADAMRLEHDALSAGEIEREHGPDALREQRAPDHLGAQVLADEALDARRDDVDLGGADDRAGEHDVGGVGEQRGDRLAQRRGHARSIVRRRARGGADAGDCRRACAWLRRGCHACRSRRASTRVASARSCTTSRDGTHAAQGPPPRSPP
jgi:hypothetical protein